MSKIEKKYINCPVCEGNKYDILFNDELGDEPALVDYDFNPQTQKIYQIVRCNDCSFVYTNPVPDLSNAYSETIDEVYLSTVMQRKKTAERNIKNILKNKNTGLLLDIGCNTGVFLDVAADNGFATEGIELSEWSRSVAKQKHLIYDKPLAGLCFKERYDVITLWGVIEHLQDPRAEMRLIFEALKPGGYVFIYTGDVDSLLSRVMGRRWYWFMGMHLMYFSRKTLSKLLSQIGFTNIITGKHVSYFSLQSLSVSMRRYIFLKPIVWLLKWPLFSKIYIPVWLPGEMLIFAKKP